MGGGEGGGAVVTNDLCMATEERYLYLKGICTQRFSGSQVLPAFKGMAWPQKKGICTQRFSGSQVLPAFKGMTTEERYLYPEVLRITSLTCI